MAYTKTNWEAAPSTSTPINPTNLNHIEQGIYEASLLIPAGAIMEYAGNITPEGYLICDGSAVSRTTYSALFSAIGTTYGGGNGSTTFNLPNLKGRVPVGLDGNDTSFDTLGETGGEKTHTLTINEIPSHDHTIPRLDQTSPQGGGSDPNYGVSHRTATQNTGSKGGGQAHNNLQPYIVVKYIIKY